MISVTLLLSANHLWDLKGLHTYYMIFGSTGL